MNQQDRGFIVWQRLLPPALLLALAATGIIILDFIGKGDGLLVALCSAKMAVAALWLLRIGLSRWHSLEE